MTNKIWFSIIMPTYNSENTIEMALTSIRDQNMPDESIEILVVDGGSTDNTIEIAQKYNAIILPNPKRFPEYAKRIGLDNARGRWVVFQDSDEVLTSNEQLSKRKRLLEKVEDGNGIYALMHDKYIPGQNCGIACAYINYFGDPFSYVVYHLSESRIKDNRKYLKKQCEEGNLYFYSDDSIIPIGDGGTVTIDILKAKELYGDFYKTQEFATSIFYNVVKKTHYVGCIPNDNIVHYSLSNFSSYLRKLKFRVYTNLNDVKQSGYSVRAGTSAILKKRKILFIIYCMVPAIPLIDSVRMCVSYKKISLGLHFVYTYYVCYRLFIEVIKKIMHIKSKNIKFGK